jgi:gliding motility-associated-like protein
MNRLIHSTLVFIITWFLIGTLQAQPLQFLDERAGPHFTAVQVFTRPDAGWTLIGNTEDSALLMLKYDYCGKLTQSEKRIIDTMTRLSQLYCSQDASGSGNILLAEIFQNDTAAGLHLARIGESDLSINVPVLFSVPDAKVYFNPVIHYLQSPDDIILGFSAGPDTANVVPYLMRLDGNFSRKDILVLKDHKHLRSIVPIGRQYFAVGLDSSVLVGFDDTLNVEFSYRLDSQFVLLDRLSADDRNFFVVGASFSGGVSLMKFSNANGKMTGQSFVAYPHESSPAPSLISTQNGFATSFVQKNGNGTLGLGMVEFDQDLRLRNLNQIVRKDGRLYPKCQGLGYSNEEEAFILSGSLDSIYRTFQAKLANDFFLNDTSCSYRDEQLRSFNTRRYVQDTLSGVTYDRISFIPNNSTTGIRRTYIDSSRRSCSYFDFMGGSAQVMGCVGDPFTLSPIPKKYATQDFSNRFMKYCWFPDVVDGIKNTDRTQAITIPHGEITVRALYCSDSIDLSYTTQEIPCVNFPNVFMPTGAEEAVNKDFNPVYKDNHRANIDRVEFEIFNRWGKKVYSTTDPAGTWDGNVDGTPAPMDSYIYRCDVLYKNKQFRSFKGVFSLIR